MHEGKWQHTRVEKSSSDSESDEMSESTDSLRSELSCLLRSVEKKQLLYVFSIIHRQSQLYLGPYDFRETKNVVGIAESSKKKKKQKT